MAVRQRKKEKERDSPISHKVQRKTKSQFSVFRCLYIASAAILTFLVLIFAVNFIILRTEYEAITSAGIGNLVNVGDYKLFLYCEGPETSKKLIFFVPGAGSTALGFLRLIDLFAKKQIRACSYDRPQRLFSGGIADNRNVDRLISDLHKLISFAKGGRKVELILAGHSLGGLISTSYTLTHPSEVNGLVLLDSAPTTLHLEGGDIIIQKLTNVLFISKALANMGIMRVVSLFKPSALWYGSNPEHHAMITHWWSNASHYELAKELETNYLADYIKLKAKRGALGIPVRLVMADFFGLGLSDIWAQLWKQDDILPFLSAKTTTVTIPGSDHGFPFFMLEVTAQEIEALWT